MATPAPTLAGRTRRTRLLVLLVTVLAGISVLSACNPTGSGISALTPGNQPNPVAGARNGYVPASVRANVNSKCSMYNFAAGPLAVMIQDAAKDGIRLATSSCYRDYAGQVTMRKYWCSVGQCGNAALPGTSNHGWGKAVDFAGMTWTSANRRWMEANAGRYGFVPLSIESWHWNWVGDGGTMHGNFIRPDLWFWYQSHRA